MIERKAILVGLGGRATNYWMEQLHGHPHVQVEAYVDSSQDCRQRAADQGVDGKKIYTSLDEALDACEADFVVDVTPPAVHHKIAARAFEAGLHVLGEKPLSDRFEIARDIERQGAEAGLKHMIAQNYRFNGGARTVRKMIAERRIGPPGQCDVTFYKDWARGLTGSHYLTEPYMLLNDMMVHHFDLMRYVLGADPLRVQAVTWNHPWGWHQGDAAHVIHFEFPDGLHATHVCVGCSLGADTTYHGDWRIDGPEGSIAWKHDAVRRVRQHQGDGPLDEPVELTEPPGDMISEFLAAIDEDREPECSAADNLKTLAMVFAAIRSAKENRRVTIE